MADQGGLSDALRQLADSKPVEVPESHGEMPSAHDPASADADAVSRDPDPAGSPPADATNGLAEAHGAEVHEGDASPVHEDHAAMADASAAAASSGVVSSRPPAHDHLKVAAVPVLAVVGLLLLVPGVWAVCLLAGIELWTARTPEAVTMAWIMLVCWPISITLLVCAVVLFRQLHRGP